MKQDFKDLLEVITMALNIFAQRRNLEGKAFQYGKPVPEGEQPGDYEDIFIMLGNVMNDDQNRKMFSFEPARPGDRVVWTNEKNTNAGFVFKANYFIFDEGAGQTVATVSYTKKSLRPATDDIYAFLVDGKIPMYSATMIQ